MAKKEPEFQKLDSIELKMENGVATVFKVNGKEKDWITGISIGWDENGWFLIMTENHFFSSNEKDCVSVTETDVK